MIADRHFGDEIIIVGSGAGCSIQLPEYRIKEQHLRIVPGAESTWTVELLDRGVPTLLNGVVIQEPHVIKDMDEIGVDVYSLKVYMSMDGRESARAPAAAAPASRILTALPVGGFVRKLSGALRLASERVHELAALTTELAALTQTGAVMDRALAQAMQWFGADVGCFCVRQRTGAAMELVRAVDANGNPVGQPPWAKRLHERCMRHLERVCIPEIDSAGGESLMAVPVVDSTGGVLGMIFVQSASGRPAYDGDALDNLTAFASALAGPLERTLRAAASAQAELVESEHIIARQVQDALTIPAMPAWTDVHVAAYRRPGTARCRDGYDVLRLANKTVALLAARVDATGAMLPRLMTEVRAAFRSSCLHADAPHVVARTVNWLVFDPHGRWSLDLFCAWLTPGSASLKYCVAGEGLSAGVVSARGDWRGLSNEDAPSIGKSRGFAYGLHSGTIEVGEVLAVATDGADSFVSGAGEKFTRTRLIESLCDTAGMAVNLMLTDLVRELDAHAQVGGCPDDITVLLARREQ